MRNILKTFAAAALALASISASAQKYNVIDKTIAVVGGEAITISDIETEVQRLRASGQNADQKIRCEILEQALATKLFLMQARVDSLSVNSDQVDGQVNQQIDQYLSYTGGQEKLEEYFGKPLYKIRQDLRKQLEDANLTQQEQSSIAENIAEVTPVDVREYIDTVSKDNLPMVPIKYQLSQIAIYPDREAAKTAVKERLLALRERIINGEKFKTLARLYSEDPGTAMRGGELGMASKSMFWGPFSDAAMSLKPGIISQIVETPDGFHLIEVLEKKGDMFNARHILMKPQYTSEDREKAFKTLDSVKTEINNKAVTFKLAANFYSQDPATRTNGGQMADLYSGSSYFEIDQLKPEDYNAIKDLKEGEISEPFESKDNQGRGENDRNSGNLVYKIIKVDKILPAHEATYENDFSQIQSIVKQERQMKAINDFINEKIKTTYILIDPMYKECSFDHEGWEKKFRQ
ncbi:MAG: peptidylprolyl isomerase [Bacteroidales bacterium]|nr:peptidylprolyl isomerase [Bacteroidales bacterium]